MLDLLIAIDVEAKYQKWRATDTAVARLDAQNPADMRRLFVRIYRMFSATPLLFEYEAKAFERDWNNRKVEA